MSPILSGTRFPILLTLCAISFSYTNVAAAEIPLVANYPMEPLEDARVLDDRGPLDINGRLTSGVEYSVPGRDGTGHALRFSGEGDGVARVDNGKFLHRLGAPLSVSMWIKPQSWAQQGRSAALMTKTSQAWIPKAFALNIGDNGSLGFDGSEGNGSGWTGPVLKLNEWQHVAFTFEPGGKRILYVNGKAVNETSAGPQLYNNEEPLFFGYENGYEGPGGYRSKYKGEIDDAHIYAAVLTPEQIQSDMTGVLPARAAQESDIAPRRFRTTLRLARFDQPFGFRDYRGQTRVSAQRKPGPDAVDFPTLTLRHGDGKTETLFEKDSEQGVDLPEFQGEIGNPVFRQPYDSAIFPGDHWLRAHKLSIWGRRDIYSTDPTLRGGRDLEIWAFPIRITGEPLRSVTLKSGEQTVYEKTFAPALNSLTLQLPQASYSISINGRAPVPFTAGLQPIQSGDPRWKQLIVNSAVAGTKIKIENAPIAFVHQKQWDEDLAALTQAQLFDAATRGNEHLAPLVASYSMEPDAQNAKRMSDAGALGLHGELLDGARFEEGGKTGQALRLGEGKARVRFGGEALNKLSSELSFSAWIKLDRFPQGDRAPILTKRGGWWASTPFQILVGGDGNLGIDGSDAVRIWTSRILPVDKWVHIAFTYKAGDKQVIYVDGEVVGQKAVAAPLPTNTEPFVIGWEQGGDFPTGNYVGLPGLVDEARFFSAALPPAQIKADFDRTLQTRTAPAGDNPVPMPFKWAREVKSFTEYVGIEVPRSPLSIYATSLTHGMSGGFKFHSEQGPGFPGDVNQYAKFLADHGYDMVFEQSISGTINRALDANSYENWMAALARNGVRGGLNVNALNNPHQALFGSNLIEFHAPKFRDAQLMAQRFARFPNFAGLTMGADNAQYSWYWDWNGPSSEHPFGMALSTLFNQSAPNIPAAPAWTELKSYQSKTSQKPFLDYIARFDSAYQKNGEYFGRAVREVNPNLAITSGSYGSEPGVGGRGGHWSTMPGKAMFAGLPVTQAYDWDETNVVKPLQNVALTDRLKSYFPDKPAWSLLDDFRLKFGRETMQRQYALALTRGIQGLGVSFLANPTNQKEWNKPEYSSWRREMHDWAHRYGGVYATAEVMPSIGILYINEQALSRTVVGNQPNAADNALLKGSHGGKTNEALFLCQAAGWPAKIVTPDELKRGLAPSVQSLLLVGLNRFDNTWNWYDGLSPDLKEFMARGGRILSDDESVAPPEVKVENIGLQVRAYVEQGEHVSPRASTDRTALLYARNIGNIEKLRAAMKNVPAPIAASDDSAIWTIPTQSGTVQYVTAINYAAPEGKNATRIFEPRTGTLRWNSTRPIYDVRLRRKITTEEARSVDLTKNAFALYALPPREVTVPQITVTRGGDNFWSAKVSAVPNSSGIPVEIKIEKDGRTATIWGATGNEIKLPVHAGLPGDYALTVTELLSGLTAKTTISVKATPVVAKSDATIAGFLGRKTVPLTIALTPAQHDDVKWQKVAAQLADWARTAGRQSVKIARLEPGSLVAGLQVVGGAQGAPRWQTVETDMVLLGTPSSNVLLLDQARGYLLPQAAFSLKPGEHSASVSHSPFIGEYDALNIVAPDAEGATAFLKSIKGANR